MNSYKKYCPNVYVALCEEKHEVGEIITLTTRRGKEHECRVWNYLGEYRDGGHMYSITREDGFDHQEYVRRRAERIRGWANNAEKRSHEAWEASKEGSDFLRLGEPIKVGHHSERRHRALIDRNARRMDKMVAESRKADGYVSRAGYWEAKENEINLSMPESLEFFQYELEKAEAHHADLKANPEKRDHGMSLPYARKRVKDLENKVLLSMLLWDEK